MIPHEHTPDDHDSLHCPQCQSMSETARILGGFAEAMEKAIEDGTFRRMGAEMARRQEEAFWKAFMGGDSPRG